MRLHNFTPHPVTLVGEEGTSITIPPSGQLVRAREVRELVARVEVVGLDGDTITVPVYQVMYGEPEGLPQLPEGEGIIVSALAMQAIREHRPDLLTTLKVFAVADPIRDQQGRVIGARALAI